MGEASQPLRLSDLANLAGVLTLARIPLTLATSYLKHEPGALAIILGVFVLTDILDGPVARRMGTVSRTGAVADGFADKIFMVNFAWSMSLAGFISPLYLLAWFTREMVQGVSLPMLALRYAKGEGPPPEHSAMGKVATIAVTLAMVGGLAGLGWLLDLASVVAGVTGLLAAARYMLRDRPLDRLHSAS